MHGVRACVFSMQTKTISESLLITILTLGVFGIINTEMGVVGIIPQIAERFDVTVSTAGLCVSVFALVVSVAAPVLPLLFSGINRRTMMLAALILFVASNILSMVTDSFAVLLAARALPAFLHPVYVAMAFTLAAAATKDDPSRGIARVFVGVSAGMVLGVPMTTFVTTHWSYEAAMSIFAVINTVVLVATFFLVPDMPAKQHNPGHQLRVLKKPSLWLGVTAFTCINGAMFGFFSFMSEFLHKVSAFSFDAVSSVLLAYGIANIVGNMLAGRVFGHYKKFFTQAGPAVMLMLYVLLYLFSACSIATAALVVLLGICAGFINISGQYMISSAAREAPDFSNGLFLTAANFGTAMGTMLCGIFISLQGTRAALFATCILLLASLVFTHTRTTIGSADYEKLSWRNAK
mgnify:FL=1